MRLRPHKIPTPRLRLMARLRKVTALRLLPTAHLHKDNRTRTALLRKATALLLHPTVHLRKEPPHPTVHLRKEPPHPTEILRSKDTVSPPRHSKVAPVDTRRRPLPMEHRLRNLLLLLMDRREDSKLLRLTALPPPQRRPRVRSPRLLKFRRPRRKRLHRTARFAASSSATK